jgi:hypothetical protein
MPTAIFAVPILLLLIHTDTTFADAAGFICGPETTFIDAAGIHRAPFPTNTDGSQTHYVDPIQYNHFPFRAERR